MLVEVGGGTEKDPCAVVGGIRIERLTRSEWATRMIDDWRANANRSEAPRFLTSANANVLSLYARDQSFKAALDQADAVDADGMSIVFASRILHTPLPERVATTDFFHDAAKAAEDSGMVFFLLGATESENNAALANVRRRYPRLNVHGHHGYFGPEEEEGVIDTILGLKTDVLWVGLGVPIEHSFVVRNRDKLHGVTWIKTCGGLYNFLSGKNRRAPKWMQAIGLEWSFRIALEPRRLFWRYLFTNFHAIYLTFGPMLAPARRGWAR